MQHHIIKNPILYKMGQEELWSRQIRYMKQTLASNWKGDYTDFTKISNIRRSLVHDLDHLCISIRNSKSLIDTTRPNDWYINYPLVSKKLLDWELSYFYSDLKKKHMVSTIPYEPFISYSKREIYENWIRNWDQETATGFIAAKMEEREWLELRMKIDD
jgi:hypothetical protein